MRFTGFIGPSYTLSSVNVDCQKTVNMYPQLDEMGTGKEGEVASLVSTPGLTSLVTLPSSPNRGQWTATNGMVYIVAGSILYSVSSTNAVVDVGSLNTSTGYVSMADNGIELVVVDGVSGYSLVLSNSAFSQITDPNFLGATQVTFLDGYFIFFQPNTQTFFNSNLYSVTFNGLATGTKSGSADNIVGTIACQQSVYMFGSQSTEVYYDAGTTPMPLARIQGAVLQVGCSAPFSIAKMNGSVFWVGGDDTGVGIVFKMSGYQKQRVSTTAIEQVIRGVSTSNLLLAKSWVYQRGGHMFYVLNIPSLSTTLVYDDSTSLWHDRAYTLPSGPGRHLVDFGSVAYGKNIVSDYSNGNIYTLDDSNFTDNGTPIVRSRTAPHLSKDLVRIFHSRFQLDMETGVGLDGTQQGTNPQAILQWSDDGGHSWSNEHWAGIGKIGKRRTSAVWRRLGRSKDRVYKITISDPVKVTLIGAELDITEGSS